MEPFQEHGKLLSEHCVVENWSDSGLANSFGQGWLANILRNSQNISFNVF